MNRLWLDHNYLKEKLKNFDIFLTKELFEKHNFKLVEEYKTYFIKQLNTMFSNENINTSINIITTEKCIIFDVALIRHDINKDITYNIEGFAFKYLIEFKSIQIEHVFYNNKSLYEVCIFYTSNNLVEVAFFLRNEKNGTIISSERFYINALENNDIEIEFYITRRGVVSNYIQTYQTSVEMVDVICKILHLKQSTLEEKEHEILLYDQSINSLIFCKPLETFESLYHEENVLE